jgi:hypothetical protein
MAAIMISVAGINRENLSCNKRGVHIWGEENKINYLYPPSSQPGTLAPLSLNREGAGTCVDTDAWGEWILMVKLFHARPLHKIILKIVIMLSLSDLLKSI